MSDKLLETLCGIERHLKNISISLSERNEQDKHADEPSSTLRPIMQEHVNWLKDMEHASGMFVLKAEFVTDSDDTVPRLQQFTLVNPQCRSKIAVIG